MKCSLGITYFLEEISSLSHSVVFFYLFALPTEEGFLISLCYSLELYIQMGISFFFTFAFGFSSFLSFLEGHPRWMVEYGVLWQNVSTGKGNGKWLQYSCLENPMNSIKMQKDMTLKDELPRLVGAQYATGEEWRNNTRKNEEMEPEWKQCPVMDVTGDGSKAWCSTKQYCKGTWNVRSMLLSHFSRVWLCATP